MLSAKVSRDVLHTVDSSRTSILVESRKPERSLSIAYNSQARYRLYALYGWSISGSTRAVLNAGTTGVDRATWPLYFVQQHATYTETSTRTCYVRNHRHIHGHESIIARSCLSLDDSREGVVRHTLIISSSFPYLRGTSALLLLSRRETAAR